MLANDAITQGPEAGTTPTCQVAGKHHHILENASMDEAIGHEEVHHMKHTSCVHPEMDTQYPSGLRIGDCTRVQLWAKIRDLAHEVCARPIYEMHLEPGP